MLRNKNGTVPVSLRRLQAVVLHDLRKMRHFFFLPFYILFACLLVGVLCTHRVDFAKSASPLLYQQPVLDAFLMKDFEAITDLNEYWPWLSKALAGVNASLGDLPLRVVPFVSLRQLRREAIPCHVPAHAAASILERQHESIVTCAGSILSSSPLPQYGVGVKHPSTALGHLVFRGTNEQPIGVPVKAMNRNGRLYSLDGSTPEYSAVIDIPVIGGAAEMPTTRSDSTVLSTGRAVLQRPPTTSAFDSTGEHWSKRYAERRRHRIDNEGDELPSSEDNAAFPKRSGGLFSRISRGLLGGTPNVRSHQHGWDRKTAIGEDDMLPFGVDESRGDGQGGKQTGRRLQQQAGSGAAPPETTPSPPVSMLSINVSRRISDLNESGFVDHFTAALVTTVVVEFVEEEVFVTMMFTLEQTPTGLMLAHHHGEVFNFFSTGYGIIAFDGAMALMTVTLLVFWVLEVYENYTINKDRKVESVSDAAAFGFSVVGPWEVFTLALIALVITVTVFRLQLWTKDLSATGVSKRLFDLSIEGATEYVRIYELYCYCLVLVAFRLFYSFQYLAGLSVISRTVRMSGGALLRVGILAATMLLVFTVSASILFGHVLKETRTWARSFVWLLKVLVTSEVQDDDYRPMLDAVGVLTDVFLVIFFLLFWFVLFNMLIAIISSAFLSSRADSVGTDSIWKVIKTYMIFIDSWYNVDRYWQGTCGLVLATSASRRVTSSSLRVPVPFRDRVWMLWGLRQYRFLVFATLRRRISASRGEDPTVDLAELLKILTTFARRINGNPSTAEAIVFAIYAEALNDLGLTGTRSAEDGVQTFKHTLDTISSVRRRLKETGTAAKTLRTGGDVPLHPVLRKGGFAMSGSGGSASSFPGSGGTGGHSGSAAGFRSHPHSRRESGSVGGVTPPSGVPAHPPCATPTRAGRQVSFNIAENDTGDPSTSCDPPPATASAVFPSDPPPVLRQETATFPSSDAHDRSDKHGDTSGRSIGKAQPKNAGAHSPPMYDDDDDERGRSHTVFKPAPQPQQQQQQQQQGERPTASSSGGINVHRPKPIVLESVPQVDEVDDPSLETDYRHLTDEIARQTSSSSFNKQRRARHDTPQEDEPLLPEDTATPSKLTNDAGAGQAGFGNVANNSSIGSPVQNTSVVGNMSLGSNPPPLTREDTGIPQRSGYEDVTPYETPMIEVDAPTPFQDDARSHYSSHSTINTDRKDSSHGHEAHDDSGSMGAASVPPSRTSSDVTRRHTNSQRAEKTEAKGKQSGTEQRSDPPQRVEATGAQSKVRDKKPPPPQPEDDPLLDILSAAHEHHRDAPSRAPLTVPTSKDHAQRDAVVAELERVLSLTSDDLQEVSPSTSPSTRNTTPGQRSATAARQNVSKGTAAVDPPRRRVAQDDIDVVPQIEVARGDDDDESFPESPASLKTLGAKAVSFKLTEEERRLEALRKPSWRRGGRQAAKEQTSTSPKASSGDKEAGGLLRVASGDHLNVSATTRSRSPRSPMSATSVPSESPFLSPPAAVGQGLSASVSPMSSVFPSFQRRSPGAAVDPSYLGIPVNADGESKNPSFVTLSPATTNYASPAASTDFGLSGQPSRTVSNAADAFGFPSRPVDQRTHANDDPHSALPNGGASPQHQTLPSAGGATGAPSHAAVEDDGLDDVLRMLVEAHNDSGGSSPRGPSSPASRRRRSRTASTIDFGDNPNQGPGVARTRSGRGRSGSKVEDPDDSLLRPQPGSVAKTAEAKRQEKALLSALDDL